MSIVPKLTRALIFAALLLLISACQPQSDVGVLPTTIDLDTAATNAAATAIALNPPRPTLPPTWTPTDVPTATATEAAVLPTATPEGFRPQGTIYFIYNGDSISELAADGSFEDLVPVPQTGSPITDLELSPDQTLLAYVGAGLGSGREIYTVNRKTLEVQQISQLGFARVLDITWRPDGAGLAFLASQTPDSPLDIYYVSLDRSEQRALTQIASPNLQGLSWSNDGSRLFFSNGPIYGLDIASGETYELTTPTGFGPDFAPAYSPNGDELFYLKSARDLENRLSGGTISSINVSDLNEPSDEKTAAELYARSLRWSVDGQYLIIATENGVYLQNTFGFATPAARNTQFAPNPALRPDSERVAYVDVSADTPGVAQVFTADRQGAAVEQITRHSEGSITHLVWAAG
jgi:Tol biopolymer transport system component